MYLCPSVVEFQPQEVLDSSNYVMMTSLGLRSLKCVCVCDCLLFGCALLQHPWAGAPFLLGACLVVCAIIVVVNFASRRLGFRSGEHHRVVTMRSIPPAPSQSSRSLLASR